MISMGTTICHMSALKFKGGGVEKKVKKNHICKKCGKVKNDPNFSPNFF